MSEKRAQTIEVTPSQFEYLTKMTKKYDLPDEGKAIRCLINYAIEVTDEERSIFEDIRCFDC